MSKPEDFVKVLMSKEEYDEWIKPRCKNCRHFITLSPLGPEKRGKCDAPVPFWSYEDEDSYLVFDYQGEDCTAYERKTK